jgi:ABC-type enterobactin transport system permease subunit
MQDATSPARLYALLVGGALTIAGIIGFFYDSSFDTGTSLTSDDVFGILAVNGWHNVVHIVTGLLGLAAVGYAARTYALVLGLVYVIVAVWGLRRPRVGSV